VVAGFDEARGVKGLSISGKPGDPVLAAADGRVVYAGSGLRGYGNLVIESYANEGVTRLDDIRARCCGSARPVWTLALRRWHPRALWRHQVGWRAGLWSLARPMRRRLWALQRLRRGRLP
ncbi:MAG: peptidoglycan DD-metalloendopeptidase family protein, partial [Rubrivivax sp.]